MLNPSKFRPVRVAVAVSVGLAIVLIVIALAFPLWHQYQVWVHGGVWCIRAEVDGKVQTLYGANCQPEKQTKAQ